ncbi:MAG: lipoyl synthase [Gammaproteobacteria bacterium]|nr:lipoyl synthase [Gammaproteobacteria bacterium]
MTVVDPLKKQRGQEKLARIPVKIQPISNQDRPRLPREYYIRIPKASEGNQINRIKSLLRTRKLASVCEEASCPNLAECFGKGTATFMIMGDKCTRRCSFCDVAHGRPDPLDPNEPRHLAETIRDMGLKYVVITSVDRDDLRDGGAGHFVECIQQVRSLNPGIRIEVLVPDFRGRMDIALKLFHEIVPDVFNHNLETVPRLYRQARPGSDYEWSLNLLKQFKALHPDVPTKSGLMLGLGETREEVEQTMRDMRAHNIDMLTLGQYLQPSNYHIAVDRYVSMEEFHELKVLGLKMGFKNVASGPLVRSSYHADEQAKPHFEEATALTE